jgi:hypothetical protein
VSGPTGVPTDAGEHAAGLARILRRMRSPSDATIAIGPGWYSLLVELDARLASLDPGYRVIREVDERYGTLSYEVESVIGITGKLDDVVASFEAKSATVCERCGGPGQLGSRGESGHTWWKTICPECARDTGYRPEAAR